MEQIRNNNLGVYLGNQQNELNQSLIMSSSPQKSNNSKLTQMRIRSKTQHKNHSFYHIDQNFLQQQQNYLDQFNSVKQIDEEPILSVQDQNTNNHRILNFSTTQNLLQAKRPPTLETPKQFIFPGSTSNQITLQSKFNPCSAVSSKSVAKNSSLVNNSNNYGNYSTQINQFNSQTSQTTQPIQFHQHTQSTLPPDILEQLAIIQNSKNFYKNQIKNYSNLSTCAKSTTRRSKLNRSQRSTNSYTPNSLNMYSQAVFTKRKKSKPNDYSNIMNDSNQVLDNRMRSSTERQEQQSKPKIQTSPNGKTSGKTTQVPSRFGTTPIKTSSLPQTNVITVRNQHKRHISLGMAANNTVNSVRKQHDRGTKILEIDQLQNKEHN